MNDDEHGLHGAPSDLGSALFGERERAIRQVSERIAAAAAQRAAPKAPDERRRGTPAEAGATVRSPPVWVAQPAAAEPSRAPVPGHGPPVSRPPVVQARAFLKSTAPLPEGLAKGGALPAPGALPPRPRAAPRTVQSRVVGLGGTAPAGDDAIEKAVLAVTSSVALPPLTLRQFASLCAELTFQPERRREILERYRVRDEAVYLALDAHWRRERAARPETRTAFADDFATHLAWLHGHRV